MCEYCKQVVQTNVPLNFSPFGPQWHPRRGVVHTPIELISFFHQSDSPFHTVCMPRTSAGCWETFFFNKVERKRHAVHRIDKLAAACVKLKAVTVQQWQVLPEQELCSRRLQVMKLDLRASRGKRTPAVRPARNVRGVSAKRHVFQHNLFNGVRV